MDKNILAALEITNHEVRLLVGEFFNTRLNILKVERVEILRNSTMGFDEKAAIEGIRKAIVNASRNLGVVIEKVLLLIPSEEIHIERIKVDLLINGHMGDDIYKVAYKEVFKRKSSDQSILVNALIKRYYINGNLTKRSLINEICETLSVDAEYYYAPSSSVFRLAKCVEKVGLQIVDIGLDALCFANEASLFDLSLDIPTVGIRIEREATYLYLYNKGALLSSQQLEYGTIEWLRILANEYQLPISTAARILYYNLNMSDKEVPNAPIYLWSSDSKTQTMYYQDMKSLVEDEVLHFKEIIKEVCDPILSHGPVKFILTGEGSLVEGLDSLIHKETDCEVNLYTPDTFGVRESTFASLLGLFYLYNDASQLREMNQTSVDTNEFTKMITSSGRDIDGEDSITKRLKKILFDR